jgi:hypothetical protein
VADDDRLVLAEVSDDGIDVADVFVEFIVLHPLGPIAPVEAALIDGHDLEMPGERRNLLAPVVPDGRNLSALECRSKQARKQRASCAGARLAR